MEIKQVYELANLGVGEALGKTDVLKEDLTNLVDVGTEIINKSIHIFYAVINLLDKAIPVLRENLMKPIHDCRSMITVLCKNNGLSQLIATFHLQSFLH